MHTRKTMYLSPIKLCDLTSKGLFDCNSDFIAIALDNGGIKVIGQASIDLWFHNERVIDLSLQDLGNKLSSISLGKLCITDLNQQVLIWEMEGNWDKVKWLPNNQLVLVRGSELEIWNEKQQSPQFTKDYHSRISYIAVNPQYEMLFIATDAELIVTNFLLSQIILKVPMKVNSIQFDQDLIYAFENNQYHVINAENQQMNSFNMQIQCDIGIIAPNLKHCIILQNSGRMCIFNLQGQPDSQLAEFGEPIAAGGIRSFKQEDYLIVRTHKAMYELPITIEPIPVSLPGTNYFNMEQTQDELSLSALQRTNEELEKMQEKFKNLLNEGPVVEKMTALLQQSLETRNQREQEIFRKALPQLISKAIQEQFQQVIVPQFEESIKRLLYDMYLNFESTMRELVDKSAKEDAKFNSLNGHLKQTVDTLNNLSAKVKKLAYKLNQSPPAVQQVTVYQEVIDEAQNFRSELEQLLRNEEYQSALERAMTDNDSLTAVLRVLNPKPLMKKLSPDIAGRLILHLLQNWQLFNDQYEWIESLVEIAPKAGDLASQLFDILSESFTKDTRLRESWTKYKERVMSIR